MLSKKLRYLRYGLGMIFASLLLAGCSSERPSILLPVSPKANAEANLFLIIFWISVAVFVIVEAALFYSVIRFRGKNAEDVPPQIHGSVPLEIAWTTAPALVLVVVFVLTWQTLQATAAPPLDSMPVLVTGNQFWWKFDYLDQQVSTANELHLPVGRPVRLLLETKDVIHSFWVPQLGGKMDLIAGHQNVLWLQADKAGEYHGQCAELCGASHANMRTKVIAESQVNFDAWIQSQKTPSTTPTNPALVKGRDLFLGNACIGCHMIRGTTAAGAVGPDLTHVASRSTIAAGLLENTSANMARWIDNPPAIKPGVLMPKLNLSQDDITSIVAYLQSLK
ncbi:MAG: cytochrome c oxidase subunit II [Chloroflexi bacterium]|nr:cytochrome c oxidase subunit II [Chloroflexota bacterium]